MTVIGRAPAWRRIVATLVDNSLVALPLGLVAAVNVWAARSGRKPPIVLAGLPVRRLVPWCVTIPAVVLLGLAEWRGGSPGKLLLNLRVAAQDGAATLTAGRAVLRSVLKTALPWELGHQAVWEFRSGRPPVGTALALTSYALVAAQIAGALRGDGRTYADVVSASTVLPPARVMSPEVSASRRGWLS